MNQNIKYTKVKLVKLNEFDELDGGAKFDNARKIITKLLIPYLKENKKFNKIKLLQLKEGNKIKLQELNKKYQKFDDSITEKDIKKNINFEEVGIYLKLNENLPEFLEQLKEKSDLLEKKLNIDKFIEDLNNEVGGDRFLRFPINKNLLKKYNLNLKLTVEQKDRYNDYLVSFILAIQYYLTMKLKFLLGENIKFDPEVENGLLNDLYKTKELKEQYEDFKEIADKQKTKSGGNFRLTRKFISSLKKNIENKKKILNKLNSNNKPKFKYEYEITIDFKKVKSIFKDMLEQGKKYTPSKLQSTVKQIKSIPGIIEKSYEDLQSVSAFFSGIKSDKQKEEEKRKKHRDAVLKEREKPPRPDLKEREEPPLPPLPPRPDLKKREEPPRSPQSDKDKDRTDFDARFDNTSILSIELTNPSKFYVDEETKENFKKFNDNYNKYFDLRVKGTKGPELENLKKEIEELNQFFRDKTRTAIAKRSYSRDNIDDILRQENPQPSTSKIEQKDLKDSLNSVISKLKSGMSSEDITQIKEGLKILSRFNRIKSS